jgi:hypothetical protein
MVMKNRFKTVCHGMPELQALPVFICMDKRIQGLNVFIIDFGVFQTC